MTLIRTISGIRGTIGGKVGEGLSPVDVVKYTTAFAGFILSGTGKKKGRVVIGRDARISGEMVSRNVAGTLMAMGADVVDCGLTTTPSLAMSVTRLKADGGIMITASHNPKHWNALKLMNAQGEFLNNSEAVEVLKIAESENFVYAEVNKAGVYTSDELSVSKHIESILSIPLVDTIAIREAGFKVCVDAVNSTGGIAVPALLEALGVKKTELLYCTPDGRFQHNPEPLPENLQEIAELVVKTKSHLGFAVDPDVDRLAIIDENGEMFGEEYTLVAVADYVLQNGKGNTVSNLSSTSALRDITQKYGGEYFLSAVGEVNVVEVMKANKAVIGGEGNGGVIYPELHYGRDALLAIALFLSSIARAKASCSKLRNQFPDYFISKNKIEIGPGTDLDGILVKVKERYSKQPINDSDGVRIDFSGQWVHLRKSNTEPVIRIYAEADSMTKADHLAGKIIGDIKELLKIQTED
jgi:phosphomannomutase